MRRTHSQFVEMLILQPVWCAPLGTQNKATANATIIKIMIVVVVVIVVNPFRAPSAFRSLCVRQCVCVSVSNIRAVFGAAVGDRMADRQRADIIRLLRARSVYYLFETFVQLHRTMGVLYVRALCPSFSPFADIFTTAWRSKFNTDRMERKKKVSIHSLVAAAFPCAAYTSNIVQQHDVVVVVDNRTSESTYEYDQHPFDRTALPAHSKFKWHEMLEPYIAVGCRRCRSQQVGRTNVRDSAHLLAF